MANHASSSRAQREEQLACWIIAGLTLVVFAGVVLVLFGFEGSVPRGAGPSILPEVNASLNGMSAILLVAGSLCIRTGKITAHKTCMVTAFVFSSLFLLTYLMHHSQVGSVPFRGQGRLRVVSFSELIPHVVLAGAMIPLALPTLHRGWKERFDTHVRIATWTLPVWLFVSVSGVLVYGMLSHLSQSSRYVDHAPSASKSAG